MFKFKDASLSQVLKEILKNSQYTYKITDKYISIIPKKKQKPKERASLLKQPQKVVVQGVVVDIQGEPVVGANVAVVGTTTGATTGIDGKFILKTQVGKILTVSFIGYKTKEIVVKGAKNNLTVVLEENDEVLDEVVVVAFGEQKKESVLASVETVKPSELKVPSSNLTTALAGRMSGVISYQRSGEPGQDNAQFFIRGVTTFSKNVSPLILIDGVELTKEDLARLQPDDIASFSIMKDATATALYGARGANGVILVTTKEGKEGKARVSVRFENSVSMPTRNVEFADPIAYMRGFNEAILTRDPKGELKYSKSKIDRTIAGENPLLYPAVDWQEMLFKDYTNNQRLNFNVNGGGKVARYYLAGSMTNDNGILNVDEQNDFNSNINLRRYLLRSNININMTNSTEVVVRLHATFDDYKGPIDGGKSLYDKVMKSNPALFPAVYPNVGEYSKLQHLLFGNSGAGNYFNPYAEMLKGYREETQSRMLAQFELKQNLDFLTKGLKASAIASVNRYSKNSISRAYNPYYYQMAYFDEESENFLLFPLNSGEGSDELDFAKNEMGVTSNTYIEGRVFYNNTFGEVHSVSGMLVGMLREQELSGGETLQKSLPHRNLGLSGRFTYAFDSRYFAEFNFGYNGSERFGEDQRFGFFPSGGIGWVASNEKFWEGLENVVSLLKFKFTYGLVGNDAIGNAEDRFFYLSEVNMDKNRGMAFGKDLRYFSNGVKISRYANRDISWETATKTNLGIELELFDQLMIRADVFHEDRTNILVERANIPGTMGLSAKTKANVGEAKSYGVDVSMDYTHSFNNDLWLTSRGNFTYATNEVTTWEEPNYNNQNSPYKYYVGNKIDQKWGYVAERLFVDDQEVRSSPVQFGEYGAGDIKFKDINKDGVINNLDMVPMGYPTKPEIVYGFGVSVGYKNFDLSVFFQGSARSSFWIDAKKTAPFVDYHTEKPFNKKIHNNALLKVWADDHWSEENQNVYAQWPRFNTIISGNNAQQSSWFMRDGTFLRLKSTELGYSLPKRVVERYG
ncbi:MAG: TonB-dependent receptor, partial [Cytophagales bacterium]|nr:TonB-dependent receptor [Cytophagales bacterium]